MPDPRMQQFLREAERLVVMPDLEELAVRGRRRQARRATAAVMAAVVAAVLGGWALGGLPRSDTAPPVDHPDPSRAIDDRDQLPYLRSEQKDSAVPDTPLRQGQEYHARPFGPDDPMVFRLEPPARGWSWSANGVVRPGRTEPSGPDHLKLVVMAPNAVRERPCEYGTFQFWSPIAATAEAAAGQLAGLPEISLDDGPERTVAFGQPAVHVRFTLDHRRCGDLRQAYLFLNDHDYLDVGVPSTTDVWFVHTESGLLVVVVDVGEHASPRHRHELATIVARARIDASG